MRGWPWSAVLTVFTLDGCGRGWRSAGVREQSGDSLNDVAHVLTPADGVTHPPTGLRAHALIASIREDLHDRTVRQKLDQPELPVLVMLAQLPGRTGLQNNTRPSASVRTMDFTAFCLVSPETNLCRSLRPAAGRRTRISVPSMIPV